MAESTTGGVKTPIARRGVASARGVSRLKFTQEDVDKSTGLFLAHLESVDVTSIKIGENTTGMPSFNGLEIPRIRFVFASNAAEANKRKYITLSFNAVESNINTIPSGKEEWKVNQILDWVNHIINVYVCKGKSIEDVLGAEGVESLSLPFTDFDENGEYVPIEPETVIAGWKVLFTNVANVLNHGFNGTAYFLNAGKFIPTWLKLIRCTKTKNKGWVNVTNGDLAFPSFVGEGAIETYTPNVRPSIHLDAIRESIIPKVQDTPKQPNLPNNPMMGAMPMGGIMDAGASAVIDNGAASVGGTPFYNGEDMPDFGGQF